jgi:FtsH-binding integral membrane protein
MPWIRTVLREIFGLFVDDGSFAVAIILWLALVWLVVPRLALPSGWGGLVLFAGLILILFESVLRRARQS